MQNRIKHNWQKILSYATIISAILFVGSTQFANAALSDYIPGADTIINFTYALIAKLFFGISYIIALIAGVAISIEAWAIGALLNINAGVFSSAAVQQGFAVTLSIANLGFVLGIIIIALATILRRETYGYKSLLWKLVAAAILVNFSLVIMAPIFNLGTSFTQYFLNCINPATGCSGSTSIGNLSSMNNFATDLSGAFNPQTPFMSTVNPNNPTSQALNGAFSSGATLGQMIVPIISSVFVAIESIAVVIVLGVFQLLLLMRYLWIAFLAILMPFAWVMWIFPKTSNLWEKWWQNFIRWTFFAPLAVFFLYLAIQTMHAMSHAPAASSQSFAAYTNTTGANADTLLGAISNFFTGAFTPIIQNILDMILMVGLSVGGMMAADSIGIKGAGAAVEAVKGVGKSVQGYAGKQGKKATRASYQKLRGEKLTAALQRGNFGVLGRIPLLGWGARRGASYAGQGLSRMTKAGGEDLVEHEMKWAQEFGKNPKEGAALLAGSLNTQKQIALLKVMATNQDLGEVKSVNGITLEKYIRENKHLFVDYEQGKLYNKDLRNVKINAQASEAAEKVSQDKGDEIIVNEDGKEVKAITELTNSMRSFAQGLKTADAPKLDLNDTFRPEELADPAKRMRMLMFLRQTAAYNPQMIPALARQLKGKTQKTFMDLYDEARSEERTYQKQELAKLQNSARPLNRGDQEKLNDTEAALKGLDLSDKAQGRLLSRLAMGDLGGPGGNAAAGTP